MTLCIEQHNLIVILAESLVTDISDLQRNIFSLPLGGPVGQQIIGLGGEADTKRR